MKILYAIGRKKSGGVQLTRFLKAIKNDKHIVKVAAFTLTPLVPYCHWTLDALLNLLAPEQTPSFDNETLEIYYQQVKNFRPDLIISDLEFFSSHLATLLNIPIIQVSPRLAYDGTMPRQLGGIGKQYKAVLKRLNASTLLDYTITNAECKLAYSYLGDLENAPKLKSGFEWIRPYHVLGDFSPTSRHTIAGIALDHHRPFIQLLQQHADAVLFGPQLDERFSVITMKDSMQISEYAANLYNSPAFLNQGFQDHIADGFYNGKYGWMMPDFTDDEAVINSLLASHFQIGQVVYDVGERLHHKKLPAMYYHPDIKYLHEKIGEL